MLPMLVLLLSKSISYQIFSIPEKKRLFISPVNDIEQTFYKTISNFGREFLAQLFVNFSQVLLIRRYTLT